MDYGCYFIDLSSKFHLEIPKLRREGSLNNSENFLLLLFLRNSCRLISSLSSGVISIAIVLFLMGIISHQFIMTYIFKDSSQFMVRCLGFIIFYFIMEI